MAEGLFRMLKIVSYSKIAQELNDAMLINKQNADEIRKNALNTLAALNTQADVPKIKELIKKTQDELDQINTIDKALLHFSNSLKG